MPDLGVTVKLGGQDVGATASVERLIAAMGGLTETVAASTAATQAQAAAEAEAAAAARAEAVAAQAVAAAETEATAATEKETAALGGLAGAAGAVKEEFVGGVAEMAAALVAFEAIRGVIDKVTEAERDQVQAQRQLNVLFGEQAEAVTQASERLAQGTNFTATQFEHAAAQAAILRRDFGLTEQQIEALVTRTADLAAASGKSLPEAIDAVVAAMEGRGRAAFQLGIDMQDKHLKATQFLTAAQKEQLTGTDDAAKGQARLAGFFGESAHAEGEAARQAGIAGDNFAKLDANANKLWETMGKSKVAQAAAGFLADAAVSADNLVKILDILIQKQKDEAAAIAAGEKSYGNQGEREAALRQLIENHDRNALKLREMNAAALQAEQSTRHLGAAQGEAGGHAAALASDIEDVTKDVDAARKAIGEHANAMEQTSQAMHAYSAEHVKTAEDAQKAADAIQHAIDTLGVEAKALAIAQQARHSYNVAAGQSEGQANLDKFNKDMATKQKEADTKAEQAFKEHVSHMAELETRAVNDRRTLEDRGYRDEEQRYKDHFQVQEQSDKDYLEALAKAREDARDAAVRALDDRAKADRDATEAEKRGLDDQAQAARNTADTEKRGLDDQAQAARDAADTAKRAIEDQDRAEQAHHDSVIRAAETERDARLSVLDVQLKQLDAEDRAASRADARRKDAADLQKAVADLAKARSTGTGVGDAQERVNEARARIAEEARKEHEEDAKAAIKAQEDVAKAAADATKQQADDTLKGQKDANSRAKQGIDDGLKGTLDGIANQKQALDDALKSTLDGIAKRKQADDDALKTALDGIEKRKQAEQAAAKSDVDAIKARQKTAEEAYTAVGRASDKYFQDEKDKIDDWRRHYDEAIADVRYSLEHPGDGAAGTFAGATSTGGGQPSMLNPPGAASAASGGRGGVGTINVYVTVPAGDGGLLDQVERAAREGTRQALAVAGPI